ERLTYGQFRDRVRQLAKSLVALGVARGDHVALLMQNRTEWLVVDFAVQLVGATLVAISTWSRPRELEYVLLHSDASTLITIDRCRDHDYLATLGEITGRLPKLARIVTVCDDDSADRAPLQSSAERIRGATDRRVLAFHELTALGQAVSDAEIDARQRAVTPD